MSHKDGQKNKKNKNSKDLQRQKRLRRVAKNTHKNYTRKVLMTQITMMVWSLPRAGHLGV